MAAGLVVRVRMIAMDQRSVTIDLDVSEQVLRPMLGIRGLSVADRGEIERLVREADRAREGFDSGEPTGARADLYIDRVQHLLRQAQVVIARYAE